MIARILQRARALLGRPRRAPDPFLDLAARYARRLERFPLPRPPAAPRGRAAVLVTPWLSTGVPLFALECALELVRGGFAVTALCDFADLVDNAPDPAHRRAIEKLVRRLERADSLRALDPADAPAGEPDPAQGALLARQNAIWKARGEGEAERVLAERADDEARLAEHIGRATALLRAEKYDRLLIPGGVYGLSGAWVAAARAAGVPWSTFDSGAGVLRLAHDGIAAHLGDLGAAWDLLAPRWQSAPPAERAPVLAFATAELDDRAAARDFRQFQVAPAAGADAAAAAEACAVLVPLNIRWDTAALARQRLFPSVGAWLEALLAWAAAHPEVAVVVRQHPRERLDFARGRDDWEPLVARAAERGARVRWVRADAPVNTYDLLRSARVVLPHTSTIGIEAAFLGKPVVLGTDCYYGRFGIAWNAATPEEYFARVGEALAGLLHVTPAMREAAGLAYFLTQRCAFIRSDFNPHREQFLRWCALPPGELWSTPETADFREALLARRPLSAIRFARLTGAGN